MEPKTEPDTDTPIRPRLPGMRSWLSIGAALSIIGLAACGKTVTSHPRVDGSFDTGATAMGGAGGATTGDTGTGGATTGIDAGAGDPGPWFLRLWSVAVGNGTYVAAGLLHNSVESDSVILTSQNGTSWNLSFRGGDEDLTSVAYGGGHWVAVGWGVEIVGTEFLYSRVVLVSEDAATWNAVTSPESSRFYEVMWTGSEFLMHGQTGDGWALWASPTGLTWTPRTTGANGQNVPNRLATGVPGLIGKMLTSVAFTDDAGANWNLFDLTSGRTVAGLWPEGDGFGGTAVYRCCFGEQPLLDEYYSIRSSDGRVWETQRTSDPVPGAVARIGEVWVGIAANNVGLVHRDAATPAWKATQQYGVLAVTAGDRFVAVGGNIWTSDDGKTWTAATLPADLAAAAH